MQQRRPAGSGYRRHTQGRTKRPGQKRQLQNRSQPSYRFSARRATSLDLRHDGVGGALVVEPADLQVVALLGPFEGEFHVRVLGYPTAPVGDEDGLAVMFERKLLDEVGWNQFTFGVLDEAGIHR